MENKAEDILGHRLNLREWKWAYSLTIFCSVLFPMMGCPRVMLMQLSLAWAPGLQLKKQQVPSPSDRTFACGYPQVSQQWKSSWWRDACGHLTRFGGLRNSLLTTEKSPSTLNTTWQRQCGNDSGFSTLPLLLVVPKSNHSVYDCRYICWVPCKKNRRNWQTFQGKQSC